MPEKTILQQTGTKVTELESIPDLKTSVTDSNVEGNNTNGVEESTPTNTIKFDEESFKNVSVDDLDKMVEEGSKPAAKNEEETESKDENKDKEATVAKVQESSATGTVDKKPQGRDYSGLDDNEKAIFQKMGNQSYNFLRPIYDKYKSQEALLKQKDDELTQLKTKTADGQQQQQLPASYYEHPDAFILSQDFQALNNERNIATAIESHWEKQLELVEDGKDWQNLDFDKDGKLVLSEPKAASGAGKVHIQKSLIMAQNQRAERDARLTELARTFRDRHTKVRSFVKKEIEDRFFPVLTDDNLTKKEELKPIKTMIDNVKAAFPDELKGNILVDSLAKAYAAIVMLNNHVNTLTNADKTKQLSQRDNKLIQPTEKEIKSADVGRRNGNIGFNDIDKLIDAAD